jgi:hypothetical protein
MTDEAGKFSVTISKTLEQLTAAQQKNLLQSFKEDEEIPYSADDELFYIDVDVSEASYGELLTMKETLKTNEPEQKIDLDIVKLQDNLPTYAFKSIIVTATTLAMPYVCYAAFMDARASPHNSILNYALEGLLITFTGIAGQGAYKAIKLFNQTQHELSEKKAAAPQLKTTLNDMIDQRIKEIPDSVVKQYLNEYEPTEIYAPV